MPLFIPVLDVSAAHYNVWVVEIQLQIFLEAEFELARSGFGERGFLPQIEALGLPVQLGCNKQIDPKISIAVKVNTVAILGIVVGLQHFKNSNCFLLSLIYPHRVSFLHLLVKAHVRLSWPRACEFHHHICGFCRNNMTWQPVSYPEIEL